MPVIDESIFVPVPPEVAFDYISDPANSSSYQAAVIRADLEGDGPTEAGSKISGSTKVLGRTFDWVAEVTELDRPTKFTIRTLESKIAFTSTYTLSSEEGGTRVAYHLESAEGLGGVFGKLADPFVASVYAHQVRTDLATLAAILPAQSGSGG